MKLLLVSDEESSYLWDYYRPGMLDGYDLILSAGDLKAEYLEFLVTMAHCPLLYVHGNHDGSYDRRPPEGCDCVDDRVVTVKGLRILGLGGSCRYNDGPWQFTEKQMAARVRKLWLPLRRSGGVDLILTHAPVRGYGDLDTLPHRGFETFQTLLDKYHPRYLVHGHVHLNYQAGTARTLAYGPTTLINADGRYELEI